MAKNLTVFQRLNMMFTNGPTMNSYRLGNQPNDIIIRTKDKDKFDTALAQAKQEHLLAMQWRKAQVDISNRSISSLNDVKLMYREADLMDLFPEIGTALDITTEECTDIGDKGCVLNITSSSERIEAILRDLFVNRLSINTTLPMICRSTCKYGNDFHLLDLDSKHGIMGWKELPVYEMERYESDSENPYYEAFQKLNTMNPYTKSSTKFVWVGSSEYMPYFDWQIAHFRLLYNSIFLPYGCSFLQKARRHFRLLSMMEDSMLIYRLERAVERRVFKINVGAIDDKDVPAYVQQIANEFKRTPIVDPTTGQLDLRKNILCNTEDFFIPVRDDNTPSPIETLPAAQNLTAIEDIKYIENKVLTALRIPKPFLNFEEAQGDGKNLSLLDVRFSKTVNRIQQSLLMELNKIAIIHLILLGFTDELTNFSITMNRSSSQAEMLEIENLAKKITAAKDAVSDPGTGIPLMSMTHAWRKIFKWSDKDISDNLEELRLEKALSIELQKTPQIIKKKTGIFDRVDNVYGEPGAEYSDQPVGDEQGNDMGGGGAPMGGAASVGDLDFGDEGNNDMGAEEDMNGQEDEIGMDQAAEEDNGMPQGPEKNEAIGERYFGELLNEANERKRELSKSLANKRRRYVKILAKRLIDEGKDSHSPQKVESTDLYDKSFLINKELDNIKSQLSEVFKKDKDNDKK